MKDGQKIIVLDVSKDIIVVGIGNGELTVSFISVDQGRSFIRF
ncbi:hypothetical protein [Bacillus sp. AFS055030]|nr:hypothetical protein [Bacillus sp. AFS055030]